MSEKDLCKIWLLLLSSFEESQMQISSAAEPNRIGTSIFFPSDIVASFATQWPMTTNGCLCSNGGDWRVMKMVEIRSLSGFCAADPRSEKIIAPGFDISSNQALSIRAEWHP